MDLESNADAARVREELARIREESAQAKRAFAALRSEIESAAAQLSDLRREARTLASKIDAARADASNLDREISDRRAAWARLTEDQAEEISEATGIAAGDGYLVEESTPEGESQQVLDQRKLDHDWARRDADRRGTSDARSWVMNATARTLQVCRTLPDRLRGVRQCTHPVDRIALLARLRPTEAGEVR